MTILFPRSGERTTQPRATGRRSSRAFGLSVLGVAALAASALVNHRLALKAERENPPAGRFIEVNGTRLHYVDRGKGPLLVMLHGNGSMIQDFGSSGLIDLASRDHRVIVFDRPGYGHSERPRDVIWTPKAQANLIHQALTRLGVDRAVVLGHSWGCSVAVALAEEHPDMVAGLVLASGYYYPTARADVVVMAAPAIPILGDVIRHTIAPMLSRLIWPLILRKLFGPQRTPQKFAGFPKEMAFRPSQLRASAAESGMMVPDALAAQGTYARLSMPVAIIAGDKDRIIDIDRQSARLHEEISQSRFRRLSDAGHMIHQTETGAVMAAIESVSPASDGRDDRQGDIAV